MSKRPGFTLLEMLIVIAILGIFLALGVSSLLNFRARLTLQQAQQVVVQELIRARSDARKLSVNQTVTWTDSSLTITANDQSRTTKLPSGIKLSQNKGSAALTYSAPYSTISVGPTEFVLMDKAKHEVKVIVYGVTGKVISVD